MKGREEPMKTADVFVNIPVKSIARAYTYRVPEELRQECRMRLTPELAEILRWWESALYNEKICGRI